MGGKGDVEISGVGGAEPRNDYSPMSDVLPAEFPVFDDGAGEIEEIPTGLPFDAGLGLYYFQSSYDLFQFPGDDGFFGFSDYFTFAERKETPDLVTAPGDYWIDFTTNRIYSYSDTLSDSYVHLCERDLEVTGSGAITFWPDKTVKVRNKIHPLDLYPPEWDDMPSWFWDDNNWWRFILEYSRPSRPHHLLGRFSVDAPAPTEVAYRTLYSHDGGMTWHLPGGDMGVQNCPTPTCPYPINFRQGGVVIACGNEWDYDNRVFLLDDISNFILYSDPDFDNWTALYHEPPYATSKVRWEYESFSPINNRDHWLAANTLDDEAILVLYTDGQRKDFSYPGGLSQIWNLGRMSITSPKQSPEFVFDSVGGDDEFDGFKHRVNWLKHGKVIDLPHGGLVNEDYYFMANHSGWWNDPFDVWNDTSWKGRAAWYDANGFTDRGIGWDASLEPDFANFETIIWFHVHHVKLTVAANGDTIDILYPLPIIIARYCVDSPFSPPHAWRYTGTGSFASTAYKWVYKVYTSTDLGESYTLVQTIDKMGSPYETTDIHYQFHNDAVLISPRITDLHNYGSWNQPRFLIPVFAHDYNPPTGYTSSIHTYFYLDGSSFLGGILSTQQWPPITPPPYDVFHTGYVYTDGTYTDIYENLLCNEGIIKWIGGRGTGAPGAHGVVVAGDQVLQAGHKWELRYKGVDRMPPDEEFWLMEFEEPRFDNYTYSRIVCDSAGFTIRAPHVNELKTKLQQLNSNVKTGGTNVVSFGIEWTMPDGNILPEVRPNNTAQPVRRNHYYTLKREVEKVIGKIATSPGSEFYCETDLLDYLNMMEEPIVEEEISIRTLLGMRKTLQALYANGWYCSCYSYCPCQTFIDVSIEGGKK